MSSAIKLAVMLVAFIKLANSMDLCNNDMARHHARNACSKLVSRYPRSIDFSDFNVTEIPDKHHSNQKATKLTHPDIPGTYFVIPHYMLSRAHSKYHKRHHHNKEKFYYGTENAEDRDQSDVSDGYKYVENAENHDQAEVIFKSLVNADEKHHKRHNHNTENYFYKTENTERNPDVIFKSLVNNENLDGFEYKNAENTESEDPEFVPHESGKHKSLKHSHHHRIAHPHHQRSHSHSNEYYEIIESELLTSDFKSQQRRNREVVTEQSENELRIRRQNVGLQQCCENPKLDACDWLLCD